MRFSAALLPILLLGAVPQEEPHRSPSDLALSKDGRWVVTANTTSHSASLVDLEKGELVAEAAVGKRPYSVALTPDGKTALVTNRHSDTVTVLEVAPPKLKAVSTIPVGDEPRGVAVSPDGSRAFVALAGDDAVAVIDLKGRKVLRRIETGDEPWHVAVTPDGGRLVVGNARSGDVGVYDARSLEKKYAVPVKGRNLRHLAITPDGKQVYVPHITDKFGATTRLGIERGRVLVNRLGRVSLAGRKPREAAAMDPDSIAAPDLEGVAIAPDGRRLAVTSGGTGMLLLLTLPLPFTTAEPAPLLDRKLYEAQKNFRRTGLVGTRPTGIAFTPDGKSVVFADYMENAVKMVDWEKGAITKSVFLGGPKKRSLLRYGERLFHSSMLTWQEWYTCHTCHTDGHTNGGMYDTFNDGRAGNPKTVLSLQGVTRTAPWTWHGVQKDLRASVRSSILRSMVGPDPSKKKQDALFEYLKTIDFASPVKDQPADAVRRGEAVFKAKACDACHIPPLYTSDEVYRVGLESPDDRYKGFNPPSLRGVRTRGPFLHDGRAKTLESLFKEHHRPLKLNGKPDCTEAELKDLIAFLKSL